ncbi:MAG TPA: TIGR00296 family protein [Methanocorpusculum sp.]|nr:TIGR00296 family protein [Methanocorpusculum sp.]
MNLLMDADGAFAVARARELVEAAVQQKPVKDIVYPPAFAVPRGVFVTLTEFGELRGCIGIAYPVMPLSEALEDAAVSAAVRDPRFRPVGPAELVDISVEVTVLTPPEALFCPPAERWQHVEVGRHGLIIKAGSHSGLLLPQVASEYGWIPSEFLSQTCIKAGLPPSEWRKSSCSVSVFEGQMFSAACGEDTG